MHFINYLPLPIYVLILTICVIGLLLYVVLDKKLNKGVKAGFFLIALAGISLMLMKIVEETSFKLNNDKFLWIILLIGMGPGLFIAVIADSKRLEDKQERRQLLKKQLFFSIPLVLFGLFILYTFMVHGG